MEGAGQTFSAGGRAAAAAGEPSRSPQRRAAGGEDRSTGVVRSAAKRSGRCVLVDGSPVIRAYETPLPIFFRIPPRGVYKSWVPEVDEVLNKSEMKHMFSYSMGRGESGYIEQ